MIRFAPVIAAILLTLAIAPTTTSAAPPRRIPYVHWTFCHYEVAKHRQCSHYRIRHVPRKPTGHWKVCHRASAVGLDCIRFPTFDMAPAPVVYGACLGSRVSRWSPIIAAAARAYGVPGQLIAGIIAHESGGDPYQYNGAYGATGLMQILPSTAAQLGVHGSLYDPRLNIMTGALLLRRLLNQYGTWYAVMSHYGGAYFAVTWC